MRLFITGATGFIGRHLLYHLATVRDVEVAVLASPGHEADLADHRVIPGRLEDLASWKQSLIDWKPDACIHLAWYAEPGKYLYSNQNVALLQQSLDLMQTLIEAKCESVVMVGTCAEYDTSAGYLQETGATKPDTIYATAKLALALMAERMAQDAGIHFAWARMFYLYGPEEDQRRLVPALINALLQGERFATTKGEQVRDYVHVADAARALWQLVQGGHSGIYNISSGYPATIHDLIMTVADLLDARELVDIGAMPYRQWEPMFICGDNSRLRATGWEPQFSLQTGLAQTVAWWKQWVAQ